MSLAPPAVWVLGAGFLGSALAAGLRRAGGKVLTLDKAAPADVAGDAADPAALARARRLLEPEAVVLCLSTRGGTAQDYEAAYCAAFRNVRRTAPGARVLFCSSLSVYGEREGRLVDETSPCRPATEQAKLLLGLERETLASSGLALRLAPLYGPGRCELLRRHLAGEPCLPGAPSRLLNYLHRDDAVEAVLLLLRQGRAADGVYDVCSETFTKAWAYAAMERLTGVAASPETAAPSRRGMSDMEVDCPRLRSLGWIPQCHFADFVASQLA